MEPISILHEARRSLFTTAVRRGFVTVAEIEEKLPPGTMTSAERWLLYYSLDAIGVEIRDGVKLAEPASEAG